MPPTRSSSSGAWRHAGDQTGHIRVWDLTASACSCELVPEIGTAVRSLTVALDGTMIVAANNNGTCYVWRMMRGGYVWHACAMQAVWDASPTPAAHRCLVAQARLADCIQYLSCPKRPRS